MNEQYVTDKRLDGIISDYDLERLKFGGRVKDGELIARELKAAREKLALLEKLVGQLPMRDVGYGADYLSIHRTAKGIWVAFGTERYVKRGDIAPNVFDALKRIAGGEKATRSKGDT